MHLKEEKLHLQNSIQILKIKAMETFQEVDGLQAKLKEQEWQLQERDKTEKINLERVQVFANKF